MPAARKYSNEVHELRRERDGGFKRWAQGAPRTGDCLINGVWGSA